MAKLVYDMVYIPRKWVGPIKMGQRGQKRTGSIITINNFTNFIFCKIIFSFTYLEFILIFLKDYIK